MVVAMSNVIAFENAKPRGRQRGRLYIKSGSWIGEWRVESPTGNNSYEWVKKSKVLCPAKKGKRYAQELLDLEIEKSAVSHGPSSLITLAQFWKDVFTPLFLNVRLKPSGREHYSVVWRVHIEPYLGKLPLREVTFAKVQGLIAQEKVRPHPAWRKSEKMVNGYASQTLLHVRHVLSSMLRMAKRMGMYQGDLPTEGVEVGEMVRKTRQALSPEQFIALVEALEYPYADLAYFIGVTGLRIGEALGLMWRNVNLTDDYVYGQDGAIPPLCLAVKWAYVRRRYGTVKKDASVRIVPIPKNLIKVLRTIKSLTRFPGDDQPVFASRTGTPLDGHNASSRALKRAGKKAGVPWVCWHALRHTSNTIAGATGMSIGARKAVYGWTVDAMALHYDHQDVEQMRKGMEAVEGALTGD